MQASLPLLLIAVVLVSACGGKGNDDSERLSELTAQANAKEAEAKTLAVTAPCSTDNQCSALHFADTERYSCSWGNYKIYSLASITAAQAKDAADAQNALAREAIGLQATLPPERIPACPAVVVPAPSPVCQAGTCVDQNYR